MRWIMVSLGVVGGFLLEVVPVSADVRMEYEIRSIDAAGKVAKNPVTIKLSAKGSRVDGLPENGSTLIQNKAANKIYIVDGKQNLALIMDEPPSEGKTEPGVERLKLTYTARPERRTINTHACQMHDEKLNGEKTGEVCFALWKDVTLPASDVTALKALAKEFRSSTPHVDIPNLPGITVYHKPSDASQGEMTLKVMKTEAMTAGDLLPPKGMKVLTFEEYLQSMLAVDTETPNEKPTAPPKQKPRAR